MHGTPVRSINNSKHRHFPFENPMTKRIRYSLVTTLLLTIACFVGCENEFQRIEQEYKPAREAKDEQVTQVIRKVLELPKTENHYQEWVQAINQMELVGIYVDANEIDPKIRERFRKRQADYEAKAKKQLAGMNFDVPEKIIFANTRARNAATLFVGPDSGTRTKEFRRRNLNNMGWLFDAPPQSSPDETRKWYQKVINVRYVLMVRQLDIVLPKHKGQDPSGHETYSLGAIECDAFLMDLQSGNKLAAIRFIMPGQHSAASFAGYDFAIPEDPEAAVRVLTGRLYTNAQEFAVAAMSECSDKINSKQKIDRDLGGCRLVNK